MPEESPIAALAAFAAGEVATSLLIGSKIKGEQSVYRMTISDSVATDFNEYASNALYQSSDRLLREYVPGYQPDDTELPFLLLSEHANVKNELERIAQVNQAPILEPTAKIVRSMNYYATVLKNGEKKAIFLKKYSRSKELTQKRGLALILKAGAYDELKERVFTFDGSFDCFSDGQKVFILNQRAFESIFDFYDPLIATTEQHIDEILKRVPIKNGQDFKDACLGHTNMMTKLAHIASKPFLKNIGMEQIEAAIAECNLEIEVHDDGKSKSLVFDNSMKNRWLILKLLEDDYLKSLCAGQIYESNSKAPLILPRVVSSAN